MTEERFGRRLRRERERRQIAIESIAANTKISASLLAALERDDVSRWPSGIFRRAFIRAYAQAIGLDPDQVTTEFLIRFPDPSIPPTSKASRSPTNTAPSPRPDLRLSLDSDFLPPTKCEFLSVTERCAAVACDAAALALTSLIAYRLFGDFWAPLALLALSYYAVGALVLGNTPGISLCARVNLTRALRQASMLVQGHAHVELSPEGTSALHRSDGVTVA